MKKRTLKIRIIATVLSVITIISVASAATVSAHATSTGNVAGDAAYGAGMGIIRQYVPGGQAIVGFLDVIFGSLTNNGPSLSDINKNISDLRNEVSAQFAEVKKQMNKDKQEIEKKIVTQTNIANKGNNFDTLMTSLKTTERQINNINNNALSGRGLNDNEKAVEIAALIGRNDQWTQSSNLHNQFLSLLDTLSTASFGDREDRDFCQLIYDDCALQVMFSGEAKDAAKPYIDRVLLLELYAYSLDVQCLKAAQTVSQFTDDDIKTLDQNALNKYNSIVTRTNVINGEIKSVDDEMFNIDIEDSVVTHCNHFENLSRTIFINKAETNKEFTDTMMIGDVSKVCDENSGNAIDAVLDENRLSADEFRTLIDYVKSVYPNKTMREYLTYIGFDMTTVPNNAVFAVSKTTTEEYESTFDDILHGKYWDASYKKVITRKASVISIDDTGLNVSDHDLYKKECGMRMGDHLLFVPDEHFRYESLASNSIINFTNA